MKRIASYPLALILASFNLALTAVAGETNAVRRVSVDEFEKLSLAGTNVVLDVRTKKEFAAVRIAGAKNLDFNSPDFEKQLGQLDKTKVYLVHCATGRRSALACEKMKRAGFQTLIEMPAGIRGWEKAGKPVER
jgi:rhodanese-related sulfurtransferase